MNRTDAIYVAGSQTVIGAAIGRELEKRGYTCIVGRQGGEPELTDSSQVDAFFAETRPDYVFLAAGKSGGIMANRRYPTEIMRNNLLVSCYVLESALRYRVKKLLYFASSCSYPKACPQPMRVESLLTGPLEPTNEAYAIAKLAGMKLCQAYREQYQVNFIAAIPADVFGPGDDFDLDSSHVVAALIHKMHEGKIGSAESVEIWGSGNPRREFIYADDLASAALHVMCEYHDSAPINLGGGFDLSIKEIAMVIKEIVGYPGDLRFDTSKPDGMPMKHLDSTALTQIGWRPTVSLRSALSATYEWYLNSGQFGEGVLQEPTSASGKSIFTG